MANTNTTNLIIYSSSARERVSNLECVFQHVSTQSVVCVRVTHPHVWLSDHLVLLLSSLVFMVYELLMSAIPRVSEKVIYLH